MNCVDALSWLVGRWEERRREICLFADQFSRGSKCDRNSLINFEKNRWEVTNRSCFFAKDVHVIFDGNGTKRNTPKRTSRYHCISPAAAIGRGDPMLAQLSVEQTRLHERVVAPVALCLLLQSLFRSVVRCRLCSCCGRPVPIALISPRVSHVTVSICWASVSRASSALLAGVSVT